MARCCDKGPEGSPSAPAVHLLFLTVSVAGSVLLRPLVKGATLDAGSPRTISFLSKGGGINSVAFSSLGAGRRARELSRDLWNLNRNHGRFCEGRGITRGLVSSSRGRHRRRRKDSWHLRLNPTPFLPGTASGQSFFERKKPGDEGWSSFVHGRSRKCRVGLTHLDVGAFLFTWGGRHS